MSFFMSETSCSGFGERFPRFHPGKEEEGVLANHGDVGGKRVGPSHPRPLHLHLQRCLVSEKKPPYSDTPIPRTKTTIPRSAPGSRGQKRRKIESFPLGTARPTKHEYLQIEAAPNTRQVMRGSYMFFVLYSFYEDVFTS